MPRPLLRYVFLQQIVGSFGYLMLYYQTQTAFATVTTTTVTLLIIPTANMPIDLWLLRNPATRTWSFGYQLAGESGPTILATTLSDASITGWSVSLLNQPTPANWRIGVTAASVSTNTVEASFDYLRFYTKASLDNVAVANRYWVDRAAALAAYGACAVSRDVTTTVRAPATGGVVGSLLNGVNYTIEVAVVGVGGPGTPSAPTAWVMPSVSLPATASGRLVLFVDANSLPALEFNGSTASNMPVSRWPNLAGADASGTAWFEQTGTLRPRIVGRTEE
jgi:hypothetical protein